MLMHYFSFTGFYKYHIENAEKQHRIYHASEVGKYSQFTGIALFENTKQVMHFEYVFDYGCNGCLLPDINKVKFIPPLVLENAFLQVLPI